MNAAQMVDQCEQRFGDTANTIVTAAEWLDYLNAAYRAFLRATKWPPLVTDTTSAVGANARTVDIPSAALQGGVTDVLISGRPLDPLPDLPPRVMRHWSDRPSTPLYWRAEGKRIRLLPAWSAGGTLTIAYLAAPTPLVAGDSPTSPVIPETYHDALVSGALARAWRDDANPELAAVYQAEFDTLAAAAATLAPDAPE